MLFSEIRKIARPNWWKILCYLKASMGMSVSELAREMKMSYMGVKQHCIDLEKKGYLDTWRRPKAIGRPEKIYRATPKANRLFPDYSNDLTLGLLEAVGESFGGNAPEKMLFSYYQKKGDAYLQQVEGKTFEARAESFVQARIREGFLCRCEKQNGKPFEYVEYHNPMQSLIERYPSVERMEEALVERVLGFRLVRSTEAVSGVIRTSYQQSYELESF